MLCIKEAILAAIKFIECRDVCLGNRQEKVNWAESGVHSRDDAREMMQAEADEVLVGSKLMDRPVRLGSLIVSSLIYLQVKG
jgi:indole-3-glycerol phosphate synthase